MLEKLKEKAKKDLIIDKSALVSESLRTPELYVKWLAFHANLRQTLRELQNQYDLVYKERWLYYNGKAPSNVYKNAPFDLKVLKSDLGVFIQADEKIQEIKGKIEEIKDILNYVEGIMGEINKRSFHIKNALDAIKWENGG